MFRTAALRRLGPWLIGLYILALVGGVLPLDTSYSAHTDAPLTFSELTDGAGAIPQRHHHAGDVDDVSHYHALQDLTGVVAWLPDRDDTWIVHVAIMSAIIDAIAQADAVRLERPPKPILSI
jgi:hypothetical protein